MNKKPIYRTIHRLVPAVRLLMFCLLLIWSASVVQAASAGFVKKGGKVYYRQEDGTYYKGLLKLDGKKYMFDKETGVMVTGWYGENPKKRFFSTVDGQMKTGWVKAPNGNLRYFDPSTGYMATEWLTLKGESYYFHPDSGIAFKGWISNKIGTRFFHKKTGAMYTGLNQIGNYYYYFYKKNGYVYKEGWATIGDKKYYFSPKTGRAQTGWLVYCGNTYYFDEKGVLYRNKKATIDGTPYRFDETGAAVQTKYVKSGSNVKVTCAGITYTLVEEFLTHPGIADGKISDEELLAAIIDSEAAIQGKIGMEACALTILNRTIDPEREFPPNLRYVIYEGESWPQYSPVRNGVLLERLKGHYEDKVNAHKAARDALKKYRAYVTKGTKRTLKGFKTKDFNYLYFMMEDAFWSQNLNFSKVKYCKYTSGGETHIFFEQWV